MGWYAVITEEMRSLGLSGTDLLVFAVIHGYSQNGEGSYYGSVPYLAKICGTTDRTIQHSLRGLENRGLIERHAAIVDGVMRVSYTAKISPGEKFAPGEKISPNNKDNSVGYINISSTSSINKGAKFQKPTLEEVRDYLAQRRSSVSAEAFYAYYESNGWRVGRNPMKNWKQAIVTWEMRDRENPTPVAPSRQKEGFVTRNKREMEKLLGALPAAEGGSL